MHLCVRTIALLCNCSVARSATVALASFFVLFLFEHLLPLLPVRWDSHCQGNDQKQSSLVSRQDLCLAKEKYEENNPKRKSKGALEELNSGGGSKCGLIYTEVIKGRPRPTHKRGKRPLLWLQQAKARRGKRGRGSKCRFPCLWAAAAAAAQARVKLELKAKVVLFFCFLSSDS